MSETKDDASLVGSWHVDYIEGRGVVDYSPAHYQFADDMTVSGNASCNRFTGSYQLENGVIRLGELATTRKMCPPALMEQEDRFLAALKRAHHWKTDNGLMYLYDADDVELFRGAAWEGK
ncbi:META domain-containing protein [Pseudomaricurvus sp.]|uniref:META domain-containing protein n=1 Tax=Pseudomaricurvus sp. TaxID=2004510 RepID=UPI003F6AD033